VGSNIALKSDRLLQMINPFGKELKSNNSSVLGR
jgi:hypothetical protein